MNVLSSYTVRITYKNTFSNKLENADFDNQSLKEAREWYNNKCRDFFFYGYPVFSVRLFNKKGSLLNGKYMTLADKGDVS